MPALREPSDAAAERIRQIALPAEKDLDFPPEDDWPGGIRQVPASYANFLFANRAVLVPTFDQPTDAQALKIFEQLFPDRVVVPVAAKYLVVGLGSLHCLSQQHPF